MIGFSTCNFAQTTSGEFSAVGPGTPKEPIRELPQEPQGPEILPDLPPEQEPNLLPEIPDNPVPEISPGSHEPEISPSPEF